MSAATELFKFTAEPGLYDGVPAEVYHAVHLASKTHLGHMRRSAAHCLHAMNAVKHSRAMVIGSALHALALEGSEVFHARYEMAGQCEAMTKGKNPKQCTNAGKYMVDGVWACGVHAPENPVPFDREILSADEYGAVKRMGNKIQAHPAAWNLLESRRHVESSMIWEDAEHGVRCKARLDFLVPELRIVGDIKTTDNASPEGFARSIKEYGYDLQAAHYLAGLNALFPGEYDVFTFIAVESEEPHCVGVYSLDEESVLVGHTKRAEGLERWALAEQTDNWPGYGDSAQVIGLPDHEKKKYLNQRFHELGL